MSGDVQPRRRKDRKKKKEEQIEETVVQPQAPPTPILANDDVNIHVHKESTLGGGICAKCVFFILMIAISVIIGFTITEHRGQTDVDIPASESRFASIFEGWVDKSLDTHDDEDDLHIHSKEVSQDEDEEHESEHDESEEQESHEEEEEESEAADDDDDEEEGTEEEEEAEIEESEQEEDVTEEDETEETQSQQESEEAEDASDDVETDEEDEEELTESQEEDQIVESEEDQQIESEEEENQADESEENRDDDDEEETVIKSRKRREQASEEQESEEKLQETQSEEGVQDGSDEKKDDAEENEADDVQDNDDDHDADDENEKKAEITSAGGVKAIPNLDSESDDDKKPKTSKSGAKNSYEYETITNPYDYAIRDELDEAQGQLSNNIQLALNLFTNILQNHPNSPRALYGKAKALDLWADKKRSNEILQESIQLYLQVLNIDSTPGALFLSAGERCVNRMRFIGHYGRAISVHKKLVNRFPNESKFKNDLAVTYLTINRISEARYLLMDVLKKWPNDGFALVHYGFIVKTVDNDLENAVDYLKRGIATKEEGVIDGRFYFHLGDALTRLGKPDEAMKIYEDGVENSVFLSKYQRSLYNVDRLTGRPWWNKNQTPYAKLYQQLELNYEKIREEGLSVLNQKGYFKDESENLRDIGDWKQFELYARGNKHVENCKKCPVTCKMIDSEPDAKGCRRGQVKFSVMHPGTHVWPHCGPTNCRLRIHLGLKVPPNTYIRVAEETRTWEEGKIFIFDDSFEHEVWHNGTEFRLVLIVDVWHPELTKSEKYNLSSI